MPVDDQDPLDNPAVIYTENRTQIEKSLRQSRTYRLTGILTQLTFYAILYAFINLLFAPLFSENVQETAIVSLLIGATFGLLHIFGRFALKQQRLAAAAQIGYSWETETET